MTDNIRLRLKFAETIENIIDDPDRWYHDETDPTEPLVNYLKEHGVTIPKLPDDLERRKGIVRLMVRVWSAMEALKMADELIE